MSKTVVIKLGGSILSKSEENIFDFAVAKRIRDNFEPLTKEDYKFIFACGGGYLCRKYQEMVRNNGATEREEHWIGTEICNVHAVMMRIVFGELAMDKPLLASAVIQNTPIVMDKPILTVGAAEPGHSSDMDAVEVAIRADSKLVISMKNVDGVYSEDPRKNPNAKKYDRLSWDEYFQIIKVETHSPGAHFPVDPLASRKANENGISFIILDGENMENLIKAIKGESFVGSVIGG